MTIANKNLDVVEMTSAMPAGTVMAAGKAGLLIVVKDGTIVKIAGAESDTGDALSGEALMETLQVQPGDSLDAKP